MTNAIVATYTISLRTGFGVVWFGEATSGEQAMDRMSREIGVDFNASIHDISRDRREPYRVNPED